MSEQIVVNGIGRGCVQRRNVDRQKATNQPIVLSSLHWQVQIKFTLAVNKNTSPAAWNYLTNEVTDFRDRFEIPDRARMDDEARNVRQTQMVALMNLALPEPDVDLSLTARRDRYRDNKVDSGTLCYDREDTQCAIIRKALRAEGFGLKDVYGEYRPDPMAYTIVMSYQRLGEGEASLAISKPVQEAINHIASTMNWRFFGYDNLDIEEWARRNLPAGMNPYSSQMEEMAELLKDKVVPREQMPRNATLNFTWPAPLAKNPFQNAVRLSKGSIVCVSLDKSQQQAGVTEQQEGSNAWTASEEELRA